MVPRHGPRALVIHEGRERGRESEKSLTIDRLSEQSLAIEKGRRRQTWLSREDRLCAHCPQHEVYDHIRDTYFPQITHTHKEFKNKPNYDKQCPSQQQDV